MSVINITKENFENEVLNADKPVLVDFWASWCAPCKMLSPVVDQIAEEYEGKIVVGKINVDEQPDLASKYNIMSIPTLLAFENGQLKEKSVGVIAKNDILKLLGI